VGCVGVKGGGWGGGAGGPKKTGWLLLKIMHSQESGCRKKGFPGGGKKVEKLLVG